MENNTPPATTPVVTQPITPPSTPVNSTFSAPPESRSKLPLIIIIGIVILLLVLGLMYYVFFMKKEPAVNTTTQNTFQQSTPAVPTPTVYDTSDEGLTNDASTIEINMSALESNAASVDSGLTETTPNL